MITETILVVDDNGEMRNILVNNILAPIGYKVITAVDGPTGLEMAVKQKPDLILLDMNMPRMTGLEMLAALRKTACTTPVILMTSYGSESIAVEAFRLGVKDYITKPFTLDEIQQSIDRTLHESRLAREREELNHNLLSAEASRITVITLSHYLNNYLTTLKGGLTLLEEALDQKGADSDLLEMLHTCRKSALSIQAVMKVLLSITDIKLSNYTNTTPIIDIETALRTELSRSPEYQNLVNPKR